MNTYLFLFRKNQPLNYSSSKSIHVNIQFFSLERISHSIIHTHLIHPNLVQCTVHAICSHVLIAVSASSPTHQKRSCRSSSAARSLVLPIARTSRLNSRWRELPASAASSRAGGIRQQCTVLRAHTTRPAHIAYSLIAPESLSIILLEALFTGQTFTYSE